ncbi:flagellar assembly protein FliW [Caldithrix abyssi]|nr:flagellar assembly protein FliW [Caldithrix abyssi]
MNSTNPFGQMTEPFITRFHAGEYPLLKVNGMDSDFENITEFTNGLPGFESLTKFLIVPYKNYPPFRVLQSLEEPEVSMLILNVKYLNMGNKMMITPTDFEKIKLGPEDAFKMYVILKIDNENKLCTVNTKAPIILNQEANLGYQVILENKALDVLHPLNLALGINSNEGEE